MQLARHSDHTDFTDLGQRVTMSMVLMLSLQDATRPDASIAKVHGFRGREMRRHKMVALEWIRGELRERAPHEGAWTFEEVCEWLGLDAALVRESVEQEPERLFRSLRMGGGPNQRRVSVNDDW